MLMLMLNVVVDVHVFGVVIVVFVAIVGVVFNVGVNVFNHFRCCCGCSCCSRCCGCWCCCGCCSRIAVVIAVVVCVDRVGLDVNSVADVVAVDLVVVVGVCSMLSLLWFMCLLLSLMLAAKF
jgi:hypothetical protein